MFTVFDIIWKVIFIFFIFYTAIIFYRIKSALDRLDKFTSQDDLLQIKEIIFNNSLKLLGGILIPLLINFFTGFD